MRLAASDCGASPSATRCVATTTGGRVAARGFGVAAAGLLLGLATRFFGPLAEVFGDLSHDFGPLRASLRSWLRRTLLPLVAGASRSQCLRTPRRARGKRQRESQSACRSEATRSRPSHSGPEMPPSLRTRQKWIAMKMTITNGSMRTCRTYQRNNVGPPISAPPRSTKRTWLPNTGV